MPEPASVDLRLLAGRRLEADHRLATALAVGVGELLENGQPAVVAEGVGLLEERGRRELGVVRRGAPADSPCRGRACSAERVPDGSAALRRRKAARTVLRLPPTWALIALIDRPWRCSKTISTHSSCVITNPLPKPS